MQRQYYLFGRFAFDARSRILTADDQRVAIPPKTADILLALLERSGELVGKDELMKLVWPDTFVEESNLGKHMFLLRKTLGENENDAPYIETIPRRGYRFVGNVQHRADSNAPVLAYEEHTRERIVIEENERRSRAVLPWALGIAVLCILALAASVWRDRSQAAVQWRSVLVLPFTASGAIDQALAQAFTQELAARLRTIRSLRVVSPLFPVYLKEAGSFSVETILSGRLNENAGRLHASAQLHHARGGTVVWAENIAGLEAGHFESAGVQIASAISARLSGRLPPAERASLERRGSTSTDAYEAYLRGRATFVGGGNATPQFESAVKLDPGFADAWAALALAQQQAWSSGMGDRSVLLAALDSSHRAVAIDPYNVSARHALIRTYNGTGDHERMLREAKTVLELDRENPEAQKGAAFAYRVAGMADRAVEMYGRYVAAYPDDDDAWYQLVLACAHAGAWERGIQHAQRRLEVQRLRFPALLVYMFSGNSAQAVSLARQSLASPRSSPAALYLAPLALSSAGFATEARSGWEHAARTIETRLNAVDNQQTRCYLAMTRARLGQTDNAWRELRQALDTDPEDLTALLYASEAYALLGDRTAALRALRRAVARGFLGLQYLDIYRRAPHGWHAYRNDPEFLQVYSALARKIADLRVRY